MRVRPGDDSGGSLIFVLIIVTVLAIIISTITSFADSSIRATLALRDQGSSVYNADGAVQAAINNIRNSAYNSDSGQTCFGTSNTLQVPYGSGSAAVTCTPDPAKVLIQCPSSANCNRPGNSILTLGKVVKEDGVNVQQPTGSTFRVSGNIFSNSNINVVNGSLTTNTKVWARGACSGSIVSTAGAVSCNYGTTSNALGDDPGYAVASATVPAYRPLPACTTPNSVVIFKPGYYDDANGLSQMMAGASACKNSTWWFTPGTYYFDFHNSGASSNPLLNSSGGNVWTVNDGYLVAGTPANGAGQAIASPLVPAAIPGSCVNPINSSAAVGVQFIFGGDSQFAVNAGQAELCGSYNVSKAPVALYGLSSGVATTTALTDANALKVSAVPTPGDFGTSATVANLSASDGAYASWKSTKSLLSGTLTVSGFAPPGSIPSGSVLTSAKVLVKRRHSSVGTRETMDLTVTPTDGKPLTGSVGGHAGSTTFQTDSLAFDTAGTGSLAAAIYAGTYSGASVALKVNLGEVADTEDIDSIQLELTYVPPAYRAESGCVTNVPYTGVGNATTCALVTQINNPGNRFYVQGTTYVPIAVIDITLNNATEQVFRFGAIARSLSIKETGSFSYTGAVIEVPDDIIGNLFGVYLNAYICPATPTCSPAVGATPDLKAKVAFVDAEPAKPIAGQRRVVVESWNAIR
jgi:Tfp pilus assembly protein PilX